MKIEELNQNETTSQETVTKTNTNKKRAGITIAVIIILLIACGICMYFLFKENTTVPTPTSSDLTLEYNEEYTNEDLTLKLSTTTDYDIVYRIITVSDEIEAGTEAEDTNEMVNEVVEETVEVEDTAEEIEYILYNEEITLEENSYIYIKYALGDVYSEEDYILEITNIDKELPEITTLEVETLSASIAVTVKATDNNSISLIEVSIDNEDYFEVTDNIYTFEELEEGDYTVYVRITDIAGNILETNESAEEIASEEEETDEDSDTSSDSTASSSSSSSNSSSSSTKSSSSSSSSNSSNKSSSSSSSSKSSSNSSSSSKSSSSSSSSTNTTSTNSNSSSSTSTTHTHDTAGTSGKWVKNMDALYDYWDECAAYWEDLLNNGEITWSEYFYSCPIGYTNVRQCGGGLTDCTYITWDWVYNG